MLFFIIMLLSCLIKKKKEECTATASYTILKFSNPLEANAQKQDNRGYYKSLSTENLKYNIKNEFLALFCDNRNNLPEIQLQRMINGVLDSDNAKTITKQDIPDKINRRQGKLLNFDSPLSRVYFYINNNVAFIT